MLGRVSEVRCMSYVRLAHERPSIAYDDGDCPILMVGV